MRLLIPLLALLALLTGALGIATWQQAAIPQHVQSVVQEQLAPLHTTDAPEIETPGPLRKIISQRGQALTRAGIVQQTNEQRQANGQTTLTANTKLNQAAEKKLNDMFAKQYFEHVSPSGVGPADVVESVGYAFIATGENLALGNFYGDSSVVQAWMDSPGHRANMLSSKFTEIGVAAAEGTYEGSRVWIAVQEFGRPLTDCPSPDATLQTQFAALKKEIEARQQELQTEQAAIEAEGAALEQEREDIEGSGDNAAIDAYNARVEAYNQRRDNFNEQVTALQAQQDEAQALVAHINQQIAVFNACLEQ